MVKKCVTCGYNNRDDARFCSSCGALLMMAPPIKPIPFPTPAPIRPVRQPGMCFYHPNLPAVFVCGRCGRPICRDCSRPMVGIVFCPECFHRAAPPMVPVPLAGTLVPPTMAYYACPRCGTQLW